MHEGRIVSLELLNFKSYRGLQSIGPFRTFTAVVGPNGSGKSNVMDAMSFVLGVRTEQLRGKLKELLYNEPGRATERGHVKMALQESDGRRVEFCRAIIPNGRHPDANCVSEYRIDEEPVPLEAYLARLQSYGVLVRARNFLVFQGDIESVAAMHPKELTKMFEHVSGSVRFSREYSRLAEEKEKAEGVMMQLHGRKKNLLAEARQKKGQMAEAEKHRQAEQTLKQERLRLCAWKVYAFEQEAVEIRAAQSDAEREVHSARKKQGVSERLVQEKRQEVTQLMLSTTQLEAQIVELQKLSNTEDPEWIRILEERKRLEKRKHIAEKKQAENHKRLQDWTHHVRKLKGDLDGLESARRRFEEVMEQEESQGVRLSNKDLEMYNEIKNRIVSMTGKLQQEKTALDLSQSTSMEARSRLQSSMDQLNSQIETWSQAVEVLDEKRTATLQEIQEVHEKIQEAQCEKQQLVQKAKEETAKRDDLILKKEKLQREIAEGKALRRETRRDASIAEAIERMKRTFPGVHGRLTSLSKVRQPKYNLAAAVALGADLDSVIVESKEVAKSCIQFLKENKCLPLNFIPLDSIQTKPLNERLRRLGGSTKLVIDLLDFDRRFEKAFLFACGNSIVCDSIAEAKHLAYQERIGVKVVTIDGTMIHKMGYITGGLSENMESRASKWDDARLAELRREKLKIESELSRLPSSRDRQLADIQLNSEIQRLEDKRTHLQSELQNYDQQKGDRQRDILKAQKSLEKSLPEMTHVEAEIAERNECIQYIKDKIDAVADREFHDFSLQLGVQSYREYEEQHLQKAKKARQQRKEFETQIGLLRAQVEYETSRNMQKPIDDLENKMQTDGSLLQELLTESRVIEERQHQAAGSIASTRRDLDQTKTTLEAKELELKEVRSVNDAQREKIRALQSKSETLGAKLQLLTEQKSDIIQSTGLEIGNEVTPDFDLLEMEWMSDEILQNDDSKKQIEVDLQTRIEELKAILHRSAPNLKAFDQYNQLKDQETEQADLLEEARRNEQEIAQAFHKVHTERHEAFMEAFQHVSAKIDEIYKELTKSEMYPYGGSATLYLESEETPFLSGIKFSAIPPSKRYREMEQLSGGEKTVVALALLFAVHSYKPCPFFILDEIDASLDAVNVSRVVDYIKKRTREDHEGTFQSIVISLKDAFFHKADCLVGIARDVENGGSQIFTFDLEAFCQREQEG